MPRYHQHKKTNRYSNEFKSKAVQQLDELKIPPGNRLEKLSGKRSTEHSIRINEQYRICFVWGEMGPLMVEVTDYH